MLQLETAQLQQPGSIPAADVAAAYDSFNAQLNSLVAQGNDIEDTATRSALLYMDALFHSSDDEPPSSEPTTTTTSSSGSGSVDDVSASDLKQQSKGVQADTNSQSEATGSSSASSSSRGGVSLQKLQRLGKFLNAAANLEPFQMLLSVLSEKQPHLASQEMLWVSCGWCFSVCPVRP
jgi:hypothetical protein